MLQWNISIGSPLVDGHLLLIFVADDEPDDSPKPPDQVEQGEDQPHHVNLGEGVIIALRRQNFSEKNVKFDL